MKTNFKNKYSYNPSTNWRMCPIKFSEKEFEYLLKLLNNAQDACETSNLDHFNLINSLAKKIIYAASEEE